MACRIVLCFVAMLLTSCPPPMAVDICNHTGEDLWIELDGRSLRWERDTILRIDDKGDISWKRVEWEQIPGRDRFAPYITVRRGQERLLYPLIWKGLDSDAFVVLARDGRQSWKLQIEPDGRLFAVEYQRELCVQTPSPQPEFFPVSPTLKASVETGNVR